MTQAPAADIVGKIPVSAWPGKSYNERLANAKIVVDEIEALQRKLDNAEKALEDCASMTLAALASIRGETE